MTDRLRHILLFTSALCLAVSCSVKLPADFQELGEQPQIYPDYTETTVPVNIAPLNFKLAGCSGNAILRLSSASHEVLVKGPSFDIPAEGWKSLASQGEDISAKIWFQDGKSWKAYEPFTIHVSPDKIDPYVTYRLIEPGYETWNGIGIYQRCLEDFTQTAIIENDKTGTNCMNCHSFAGGNPQHMVFHMRGPNGGTYVIDGKTVEKLNTKTPQTISALVYPQWHPSGRYIAFSVNDIAQVFHSTDPNRVEVYDSKSDVVVYDVERHEVMSCPVLMSEDSFETYPSFSPDGKKLYFCSSAARQMPQEYKEVKYSICSIDFDPSTACFGDKVDTLYSGKSAVFPRISPDGRFLMFTESAYGCFPIWHKDAELRMIDLRDGSLRDMAEINSPDVDSYHSWSSGSRWVIFSSRREDGLYTRLYITHIDKDGNTTKPFMLPQRDPDFSMKFFKSFNIPEFTLGKVEAPEEAIAGCALNDKGKDISWKQAD